MRRRRRNTGKIKYIGLSAFIVAVFAVVGFNFSDTVVKILGIGADVVTVTKDGVTGEKTSDATLTFTGDIMCHSYQYNEAYDASTGTYDFSHNFTDMKKYFDEADLVVGNLETVFAGADVGISDYPCFNSPDAFADAIADAGFDVLTTANNHSMDKRMDGVLRTLDVLDERGIDHIGTYRSAEERENILIRDVNGIKIAFLSYTYGTNGIPVPESWLVNPLDEELIKSDIARAKALEPDMIVVLPHMGNEYEEYVRDTFKNWAHMMLEAGADIVVASHPHVLQPMETVELADDDGGTRTGFIMYSMGNFISSQTTPPRNASILLNIDIEKTWQGETYIKEVSFVPIWTQFQNANWQNHFVVRSVYEMLTLPEDQLSATVRSKDIPRLREIHFETTKTLLGEDIPLEDIRDEYIYYARSA
ncbi:MAG TPA: CapA family protein [Firmicutes bacterium]|nr:CapA family protein [Bacillota bacterium]